ncbi:hypothetical protein COHA_003716 [Chlorella ohadii]|uniref:Large ribosomal subunit protein mL59 domain-containing protein n=1 Tax=Chlorella ohadii TaxID=2649997 RepID=A0AAD5DQX4_9CHLO|nr:hypothetical protein COHA_003716 [Chlorella ohadii]
MSARKLLEKLGQEALRFRPVAGSWHKPAISAKNAARLRKETLAEGGEWAYERAAEPARRRKPKGHKHDREKPLREAEIARKLEQADQRIADYRAAQHAPMREASLMDRLLLTPKQIRQKVKNG